MEIRQIVRALARWWWLIAIPTAITLVWALPDLLNTTVQGATSYSTTITYNVAQQYDAVPRTEGDYQDLWLASGYTVDAFTEWATGDRFKAEAVALADANLNLDWIGIGADHVPNIGIGRLYLSYPSAEGLAALTDAAIEVLSTRSQDYFAQLGGEPARVTIISRAPVNVAPPSLPNRFAPLLRVAIGFAGGLALALLAHYLDPFVRRRDEVESLGITVIGSIPRR